MFDEGVGGLVVGADSTSLSRDGLEEGVLAVDNEGEGGADTPNSLNFFLCSAFCFFNNRAASISALLCSLASRLPFLVAAPVGRAENQDMGLGHELAFTLDNRVWRF